MSGDDGTVEVRPGRHRRPNYRRTRGHALLGEGAAHNESGHLIGRGRIQGHARCQCGTMSPVLDSGKARQVWYATHISDIRAAAREELIQGSQESGYACIPLAGGQFALVDAIDLELASLYPWAEHVSQGTTYARNRTAGYMHRLITGAPDRISVDHANHDGLDNRRTNLRIAGQSNNSANSRKRVGRYGFRGVQRDSQRTFSAVISVNYRRQRIGGFRTAEAAAHAYDDMALTAFGEFATLNFPGGSNA